MTFELNYIRETITLLEKLTAPDSVVNNDEYLFFALRILKCDSALMNNEQLKKLVHIGVDMDKFRRLEVLFQNKMRKDMGEEKE